MEVFQQVLVFSTVGYTFLLTDPDKIGNGTYTDITQLNEKNVTDLFLQKCEERNVTNIIDSLKEKLEKASMCSSKFMNLSNVESDLRKAIETKSLDNVFQRYCKIWTPFMNCLNETILVLKECLDEDEKYQVDVALDIFDYMQVTLCSHGAIKFRQFYKEGGLDCVQEEWENIKKCIDEQKSIPKMLRQGNCQDFGEIRVCISEKLKFFNNSGPTEAINDMMQLLDEKFCNNASVSTPAPATGHQSLVTPVLLIAVFYLTLLITYF